MLGGGGLAPPLLSELAIEITAIFGKGFPRWYLFHSSLLGCLEINPNLSLLGFVWASFFLSFNTPVNTNMILPKEPQLFCLELL